MQPLSFSPLEGNTQKKLPVMDMKAPRRAFPPSAAYRPSPASLARPVLSKRRVIDGAHKDKHSFLVQLHEQSLGDTLKRFWRKAQIISRRMKRLTSRIIPDVAPRSMLYGSIVGGIAFGMVSMAFMEHYFGPGVFARSSEIVQTSAVEDVSSQEGGSSLVAKEENYSSQNDIFFEYFGEAAKDQYEENIRQMVKGYPIEEMLPYILEQDRITASFLIGIGKKESNWGKRVPVLDEQDCFNYWGYRGVRRMMGSGGHTCFNSRKDAVETVAKRIKTLVQSEKLNTPEKMIVWKCGFSCQGHSRESVKKWISDVDMYFAQANEE